MENNQIQIQMDAATNGLDLTIDISGVQGTIHQNFGVLVRTRIFNGGTAISGESKARRNKPINKDVPLILILPFNYPTTSGQYDLHVWVDQNHLGSNGSKLGTDNQPYVLPITLPPTGELEFYLDPPPPAG